MQEHLHTGTNRRRPLLVDLRDVGRDDLDVAGGKGANLGELIRAEFPVPPGFVVTTEAYTRFVEFNRLETIIIEALGGETAGTEIRTAFESAPIPDEIKREIVSAYARLGHGPVAVRSSATAEDLPDAAFAGQQDTFLNILGENAVLDSVRRCWASLWTDRVIAYRHRLGLDQRNMKLAVVVQQMVPAEAAGVMFTANPVTGARDEIVIDATAGLGEAIVAGLVTPDHAVLRRRRVQWLGRRIVERRHGRREVVVRGLRSGGTQHVTEESSAGSRFAIGDHALVELARVGAAIERHFGRPQDIEWAWAEGRPFILQARPITALPAPLPRVSRPLRLLAGLIAELLPDRPYPLEVTTWASAVFGFVQQFVALLGLRVRPFRELFIEEDGVIIRLKPSLPIRPTPAILVAPFRLFALARRYDAAHWRDDPLLAAAEARTRDLEQRDLTQLAWDAVLSTVREALAIPEMLWELRLRSLIGPALAVARLRLLSTLLGRSDRFGTLVFTGIETKTIQMNRVLEALANRIRSNSGLTEIFSSHSSAELWSALETHPQGREFLSELQRFIDEYGHREVGGTLQISQPTWKDAPEIVLGMLQGFARNRSERSSTRSAWEAARDEVLAHPLLRIGFLRSSFLRVLEQARWFPQMREDTRFYFMRPMPVLRRALIELGRRLTAAGVLDRPDDVFHLTLDELEQLKDRWPPSPESAAALHTVMLRRRTRRAELEGTPVVDPRLLGGVMPEGDVLLHGIPGSPGIAEGPVRIVREASQFGSLRAGEVLVAPYTNPAWTPLFERAAAVVVDSGGPASHAAIVAREYGIPAVMATGDGTKRLSDGQRVRVDGSAGIVLAAFTTSHP